MKAGFSLRRAVSILCLLASAAALLSCGAKGDPFARTTPDTAEGGSSLSAQTPAEPEKVTPVIYSAVRSISAAEAVAKYGSARLGDTDELYEYRVYHASTHYTLGRRPRGSIGPFEAVCPDPLCRHAEKSSCPFAGILSFVIHRDHVIYVTENRLWRDDEEYKEYKLKCYDMKTAAARELYRTVDDRIGVRIFDEDRLYVWVEETEGLKRVINWFMLGENYAPAALPLYTVDTSADGREEVRCIYKNKVLSVIDSEDTPGQRDLVLTVTDDLSRVLLCKNYQYHVDCWRQIFDQNKYWLDASMEILDLDTLEKTKVEGKWALAVTERCILWISYGEPVEGAHPGNMVAGNGQPYILTFENYQTGETETFTINKGGFFTYGALYFDGMLVVNNQPYNGGVMYEAYIDLVTGKWQFTKEDVSDDQDYDHPELYILHDPEELTAYTATQLYGE